MNMAILRRTSGSSRIACIAGRSATRTGSSSVFDHEIEDSLCQRRLGAEGLVNGLGRDPRVCRGRGNWSSLGSRRARMTRATRAPPRGARTGGLRTQPTDSASKTEKILEHWANRDGLGMAKPLG
jgi:hypothetical protein